MTVPLHTGTRTSTVVATFTIWELRGRLVVSDARELAAARTVVEAELAAVDRIACPHGAARVARRLLGDRGGLPVLAPALWPNPYGVTTTAQNTPVHHVAGPHLRLHGHRPLRLAAGPSLLARAAQRCAEAAAEATRCGVLVALGGETATSGLAPVDGWRIQLPAAGPEPTVIAIDGGAVSVIGLPTAGRLRRVAGHRPTWRHVVVLAAGAPAASAAAAGAVLRGAGAPAWLAEHGLGARLVDRDGHGYDVGRWPPARS